MRTILITGASGGLAQSMVALLPQDQLILLGRDKAKLEELYGHLSNCYLYQIDVTQVTDLERIVSHLYDQFGKIDILVNNAGYGIFEPFDQISDQDIQAMFEVNTFALMNLSRLVGSRMAEDQSGHIVNIVSMAGLIASSKSSLYSATKFAAIGFSNALRLELAEFGVQVTTVNPGPFKTAFFDQADPDGSYVKAVERYMLTPEQVAQKTVALFGTKKRQLNLPLALNLSSFFYNLFPSLGDYLTRKVFNYK